MVNEQPLSRKKRGSKTSAAVSSTKVALHGSSPEQTSKRLRVTGMDEGVSPSVETQNLVDVAKEKGEDVVTDLTLEDDEEVIWTPVFSVGKRSMTLSDSYFEDPYVAKGIAEGLLKSQEELL